MSVSVDKSLNSLKKYKDINRDRVILSKGHAGSALYSVLAHCGYFDVNLLDSHYANGSMLSGHVSHKGLPGIEVSTGSLGQGVSMGVGFALSAKIDGRNSKIYVVSGDGECDEGTVWEAALFANQYKLDNFTLIVDRNNMQAMGTVKEVLDTYSLKNKFEDFGFFVIEVDGHNHKELKDAILSDSKGKPKCVIAKTIKGKGVSFMENHVGWHGKAPNDEEYAIAMDDLRKVGEALCQ